MRNSGIAKYLKQEKSYKDKLSLSEQLALDRTILANERTFLSYSRTSLTVFVVGVTFIKLFNFPIIEILGWVFLPISFVIFFLGVRTFKKIRAELYGMREKIEISDDYNGEIKKVEITLEK